MEKQYSQQVEVLKENVSKKINEMKTKGYAFKTVLNTRTTPILTPDSHGVSYGGESYVELLFELEK